MLSSRPSSLSLRAVCLRPLSRTQSLPAPNVRKRHYALLSPYVSPSTSIPGLTRNVLVTRILGRPSPVEIPSFSRFASSTSFLTSSLATNMPGLTPPQPPPTWKHTPNDIQELVKKTIDDVKQVLDKIGSLSASECNFESVSNCDLFKCIMHTHPH